MSPQGRPAGGAGPTGGSQKTFRIVSVLECKLTMCQKVLQWLCSMRYGCQEEEFTRGVEVAWSAGDPISVSIHDIEILSEIAK